MLKRVHRVIAVAAHPDDVEPAIGGTLALLSAAGIHVTIVVATNTGTGATSIIRQSEGFAAAKILGCDYEALNLDQNAFNYNRENIQVFDRLIDRLAPNLVFYTSATDSHNDHQTLAKIIEVCGRQNKFSLVECNHAIPGGLNFPHLNFFRDISNVASLKYESIGQYFSQKEKFGDFWLDSIRSRDRYIGGMLGVMSGEAARIVKWID